MSKYVDGFVLVVPKGKAEEYRKMADAGRDLWMKHGALEYLCIMHGFVSPVTAGLLQSCYE